MPSRKKIPRRAGDVVAIELDEKSCAFGVLLEAPLVAFFDFVGECLEHPEPRFIVRQPVAFRIWVTYQPVEDGS